MLTPPQLLTSEARLTAVVHLRILRAEIHRVMGPAIHEVMSTLAAQGILPAGPVFSHHFRMDPGMFDFEVGVPVTTPVTATGRVTSSQLPSVPVLRTIYQGPYEGLGQAWQEFDKWIRAEGHTVSAELWECYLSGPDTLSDSSLWRTELTRPLVQAAAGR